MDILVNMESIGYLVITLIVSVLGLFGNALVIGALLIYKRLRVLNNIFIGNLALADLFVAGIIHPFTAVAIIRGKDFYHQGEETSYLCEFLASFCVISCTSSVNSIAAVALNRYVYICHHQVYHKIYTRRTVPLMVLGIWCIGFIVDVPLFVGFGDHQFHQRASTCIFDTTHIGYKVYFLALGIAFPIGVITYSYARIVVLVVKARNRVQNRVETESTVTSSSTKRIRPADVKLLKTVAAIGVLGVIIYTPLSITLIFDTGQVSSQVWMFSTGLMHSYSCINFCVYALTNSNFRTGYKLIFRRILCRPFFKGQPDLDVSQSQSATEMTGAAE